MKIGKLSPQEWSKTRGSFADKKLESFIKAVPLHYKTFFSNQTAANETVLMNNIDGLKSRIAQLKKEKRGDREATGALDTLTASISKAEKQIEATKKMQAQGLKAHLDLRAKTLKALQGFQKQAKTHAKNAKATIGTLKIQMKAQDWETVMTEREVLLGHILLMNGLRADMKEAMIPVRNPTGGLKKSLALLPAETKLDKIVPPSNEVFTLNTAIVKDLRAARKEAEKWAEAAKKVAEANMRNN